MSLCVQGSNLLPGTGLRLRKPLNSTRRAAFVSAAALLLGSAAMGSAPQALASSGPAYIKTLAGPAVANLYSSGLAWDAPSSRLVVADTGNDRIVFYNESGTNGAGLVVEHD